MSISGKEEVRDTIVEVASVIFSKFGFRKTTVDEIAIAARKGKSSIYYYFNSKEDIFMAVVEREAHILRSKILEAISGATDPREKLKIYILTRMTGFKSLANFYEAIKNDYLSHLEFIETIRQKYDEEEANVIRGILQEGIDKGIFQIPDPTLASMAMGTVMKGLEIPLYISGQHASDIGQRLDDLLDILFFGIMKR